MTQTALSKRIFLKASRADVWAYLTQPDKLGEWFHAPKVALSAGSKLEMFGAESGNLTIWGDVIHAKEPEYLEYSFTITPMGDTVSRVKWTLTEVEGGTQLDMLHEGLPQGEAGFGLTLALDNGWDEHFIRLRNGLHSAS